MDQKEVAVLLCRYIGGQLEVQNPSEDYLYRGEVEVAEVITDSEVPDLPTMHVKFKWLAQMEDDHTWGNVEQLEYELSMLLANFEQISDGRLMYVSPVTSETGVFFPPGGSALDPRKVRGLNLT